MAPPKRKGVKFPFQVSICMWIDLLGYGSQISNAEFNPLHPDALSAIRRIKRFHETVAECSSRNFPTLVMNDGAVAYRDLSLRSNQNTYEFLRSSCDLFSKIRAVDTQSGHPGPRAVMAVGFRVLGRKVEVDPTTGLLKSILRKFNDGAISANQAILEASKAQRKFDIVPQLQANFAFTKAYAAEASGKAGGIEGSNLFIDSAIFDTDIPLWFEFNEKVDWKHPSLNMDAQFLKMTEKPDITWPNMQDSKVRDGLSVAKFIAKDDDVLSKLRASSSTVSS